MIKGVDVASYQAVEFPTSGYSFAIVKATEGTSYTNPRGAAQVLWAREHDMHVGHYHFARKGSMRAQADYFLAKATDRPGDSFWLDWEDSAVSNAQKDEFIRYVKSKRPNARVGLYCNVNFWTNLDRTSYAGDALWIARYGGTAGQPGIQAAWLIHQYSEDGGLDKNVARFDSKADMIRWAGGANTEDIMALSDADIRKLAKTDGAFAVSDRMKAGNPSNGEWKLESILQYIADRVLEVQDVQRVQDTRLASLESTVASLGAKVESLEPSALVEKLRAELAAVEVKLEVGDEPTA